MKAKYANYFKRHDERENLKTRTKIKYNQCGCFQDINKDVVIDHLIKNTGKVNSSFKTIFCFRKPTINKQKFQERVAYIKYQHLERKWKMKPVPAWRQNNGVLHEEQQ